MKLNPTQDFLTDKVDKFYLDAEKTVNGANRVNSVAMFPVRGREAAVPLDTHIFLSDKFLATYPQMLQDAADLIGMPPCTFLKAVMMAHNGMASIPFAGPGWIPTVLHTLHHVRPNYVVVCAAMAVADITVPQMSITKFDMWKQAMGFGMLPQINEARPHLVVYGTNPVRSYLRMGPIEGEKDNIKIGKAIVLDSLKDRRPVPGILGDIYTPSEN